MQRLQRDPDRDVRYFAGVEEDALDSTYEGHVTSLHTAQDHFQDMSYDPEEDLELENQTPEDGENRVEDLNKTCRDNLENRTETLDSAEQRNDFDQTVVEDLSSTDTLVDTNLESTTEEFEENERRLDLESEGDSDQIQIAADDSGDGARSTEETVQQAHEVQIIHCTLPK